MAIREILQFICNENASKTLYFTRKMGDGYLSYSPEVDESVMNELVMHISKFLGKFEQHECIQYSPTGYRDGTIEECDTNYVGNYDEIIKSFDLGNVENAIDEVEKFIFYCIEIKDENKNNIKLFRRVKQFRRLSSKGLVAWFQGNRLNKIEDNLLGLDGSIDLIVFKDKIYILQHTSLERIFKMEMQFLDKANEAIKYIRKSNKIENIDQFEEDCINDLRIRKIITKIL